MNLIGNGVVIDPITLKKEIEILKDANVDYMDRLLVSKKAAFDTSISQVA